MPGSPKYVYKGTKIDRANWYYCDSCDTIIKGWYATCTIAAGIVALIGGQPGAVTGGLIAAICGGIGTWISTAQSNSTANAIVVKVGDFQAYKPTPQTPADPARAQVPVAIDPP